MDQQAKKILHIDFYSYVFNKSINAQLFITDPLLLAGNHEYCRVGVTLHHSEATDLLCPTRHSSTLTLRRLMSYIYGAPILDVSRSHTTTQHSR